MGPLEHRGKGKDTFIPVTRYKEMMVGGGTEWVVSRVGLKECGEEKISFLYRGSNTEPSVPQRVHLRLQIYNRPSSNRPHKIQRWYKT